ncbi:hypothetical protein K2173_012984 [Erythroxylum novogranatense]|uniref:TFIIS N-terminal domain-containing protein n=1 Tax=Erythroxylum novogranatense TaxID=1862640 RepID=A0AAV8S730_9ROSI|nr:hypothetical protein K2173_012984 [Erythroxylum novogranatense]
MHATVQPRGRSPKSMNGLTSHVKSASEGVQNRFSSFRSQTKGKKRDRVDQSSEPVKRERLIKVDDGEANNHRPESFWKTEIVKFTEKGGLVDSEAVEKLVQLMQLETSEKKISLVGRSILAGVVAATDKFDCLDRFVQMRGLTVFNEWLQEVHKGKIGDGSNSLKDSDKSIEDFLLVLLRALDKLPVNLQALQMCNVGKSVNHLRTHKNLEIHKKARSLVDTWKKRVEAEMDARSGSDQTVPWPARSRLSEGNRHSVLSSEVVTKGSGAQLSPSKAGSAKLVQGEMIKSASTPQGFVKSAASPASMRENFKEGSAKNLGVSGASDLHVLASRDERSSSSSQSHNNSQSCSIDHGRSARFSAKEDARSSSVVSVNTNKIINGSTRHRKSTNGFPSSNISEIKKETRLSRSSSSHRNPGSEKLSESALTSEMAVDTPMAEVNSPKIVVKIPNQGCSPAQSASGGYLEEPSVMNSRASSPALSDKHDQFDHNLKEKIEAYKAAVIPDVNTESWQSNDLKEVLAGSDEGDGSPATASDEHCRNVDDSKKLMEVAKTASSSSGNEHKSWKLRDASFSSMNALIESCAKYTKANATMSAGDDVGMNLLASVAAGEISKSDMTSPIDSPQRNTPLGENSCKVDDSRVKSSPDEDHDHQSADGVDDEHEKLDLVTRDSDGKSNYVSQENAIENLTGHLNVHSMNIQLTAEACLESNAKSKEMVITTTFVPSECNMDSTSDTCDKETVKAILGVEVNADGMSDTKEELTGTIRSEGKVNVSKVEVKKELHKGSSTYASLGNDGDRNEEFNTAAKMEQKPGAPYTPLGNDGDRNEEFNTAAKMEHKPSAMVTQISKGTDGDIQSTCSTKDVISESIDDPNGEKGDEIDCRSQSAEMQRTELERNVGSTVSKGGDLEEIPLGNQIDVKDNGGPVSQRVLSTHMQEPEQQTRSRGSKMTDTEADEAEEAEECTSTVADALSAAGGPDMEAKIEFDLNEGFDTDNGRCGDPVDLRSSGCPAQHLISPLLLPVSTVSTGMPASITVAAACKRPFIPPDNLLKNKGELLGWKGSAATSAFRPAEPRKVLEMSVGPTITSVPDATNTKPSRLLLDIDLNVPDERILEDLASCSVEGSGASSECKMNFDRTNGDLTRSALGRSSDVLDLDLNKADEPTDVGIHLIDDVLQQYGQLQPSKSSSGGLHNGNSANCWDFDLNNGPLVDEIIAEPTALLQLGRNSAPSQPSVSGIQLNNTEVGNFSSWFPRGYHYPTMTIQSILPDRGEQPIQMVAPGGPQRMLAPPHGGAPFSSDIYRGPVLSSSPALPFPSTSFQYPVFPFETRFPLPSATFSGGSAPYVDSSKGGRLYFPPVHSHILTPTAPVPTHYPRPCLVNFTDSNSGGSAESNKKWGKQGLDLNSGPFGLDAEGRDEIGSLASRQLSAASSQALLEDQSRIYSLAGSGILKRKKPEGGWEGYKQSSWQ